MKSVGLILAALPAYAADKVDLSALSLEALTNTEVAVTSVAKRSEKLSEAAAAIYVISREDIRRSGVTNIPDALRMAPGVQVAQIDSSRWAISIRGFNFPASNKLLILVDGRIVYDPLFAQTYWNAQDVMLEDVSRIEVIRGPSATLWGSNAVNGVINIITLPANETQGNMLSALAGNHENNTVSFRHGGQDGDLSYRVYGKRFLRNGYTTKAGTPFTDDWGVRQFGFRTDWKHGKDSMTLQGNHYDGDAGLVDPPTIGDEQYSGTNVLAKWSHTYSPTEMLSIQAYYDRTDRSSQIFGEHRENSDLEIQYNSSPFKNHSLVVGVTARRSADEIPVKNPAIKFDPQNSKRDLYSIYINDEIALSKKFRVTLGNKFEHNAYTGWENQPTARGLYKLADNQTLWASASRAVRIPTRVDSDIIISATQPGFIPVTLTLKGNRDFKAEVIKSYELGYRVNPSRDLSFDLTTFYVDYDSLETQEFLPPVFSFKPFGLFLGLKFDNRAAGTGHGTELAANWTVNRHWKLSGSYTHLTLNLHNLPSSKALTQPSAGESPEEQYQLRSSLSLGQVEFDSMLYYVDAVTVPDYTRVDVRLGWHVKPNLEVSAVAQNLFSGRHAEYGSSSTYIVPSTFAKVTWGF